MEVETMERQVRFCDVNWSYGLPLYMRSDIRGVATTSWENLGQLFAAPTWRGSMAGRGVRRTARLRRR